MTVRGRARLIILQAANTPLGICKSRIMQRARINSAEWNKDSRELMQNGLLKAETKQVIKKGTDGNGRHRLSANPPLRTVTLYKTTKQGVAYYTQRSLINTES